MFIKPPEDLSTFLLLNRLAEVLFTIQKLDQEQKECRELLGVYLRIQQQDQGKVRERNVGGFTII